MPDELSQQQLLQMLRTQQQQIEQLQAQIGGRTNPTDQALIDINDVRVPYVHQPFPVTRYKVIALVDRKTSQVDHPGLEARHAHNPTALAELEADGYLPYADAVEALAVLEAEQLEAAAAAAAAEPAKKAAGARKARGA